MELKHLKNTLNGAMSNAVFTPTTPHFLQPLLPGFHHHLSIPLSFFKYYLKGEIIRDTSAVLRSNGRTWSVKIRDRRFEDGWEEFARDHDLHVGDFLLFGYGGNMLFDVVVFDTSACRREFPLFATKAKDPAKQFGNIDGSFDSALKDHIEENKLKRPLLDASRTPSSEKRAKHTDSTDDVGFNSGALASPVKSFVPPVQESSNSIDGSTLFDWAMRNWPVAEIEGFRKMPSSQVLRSSVSLMMQAISMQLGVHDVASDMETLVKEKQELELKLQTLEGELKAMKEKAEMGVTAQQRLDSEVLKAVEQFEDAQKQRDIEAAGHNEELKKIRNQLEEENAKRVELEKSLENEHLMKTELMKQIDYTGASYRQFTLFEVQLQYGPLNFSETPFKLLRTPPEDFDVLNPSEEDLQRVRDTASTGQEAVGVVSGGVVESTTSCAAGDAFIDDN